MTNNAITRINAESKIIKLVAKIRYKLPREFSVYNYAADKFSAVILI